MLELVHLARPLGLRPFQTQLEELSQQAPLWVAAHQITGDSLDELASCSTA
jgi:hypothetical protein